jgi:hypothetical protein
MSCSEIGLHQNLKKWKVISGLKAGKIIQKANKHFSEAEKYFIIQELVSTKCTKAQIWKKHTDQLEEHGQLLRWMRQLGYNTSVKTRRPNFDTKTTVMSIKKSKKETSTKTSLREMFLGFKNLLKR